jgi:hypothetical protein
VGGVNRGRGDAELIWGEESAGRTSDFEAKLLRPSRFDDPESSLLIGVGSADPKVDAVEEGAGLAEVEASTGSSAWRRRLSPHHRRAVGSFFTRDSAGSKPEDDED